jgi:signal transduction histidine kinase
LLYIVKSEQKSELPEVGIVERRLQEEQAFLAEAGAMFTSSLDYETTLANVAHLTVTFLADWCLVDVVEANGWLRRVAAAHADAGKAQEIVERSVALGWNEPTGYVGARWIRSGLSQLFSTVPDEVLRGVARDADHLETLRGLGLRSAMLVPLRARGGVIGLLFLLSAEVGRQYGQHDLELAEELARRAAQAVDNARLFRDLSALADQQATLAALGQRMAEGAPVGELLGEVVTAVTRCLGVPVCEVLEHVPDTRGLVVRAHVGAGTQPGQVLHSDCALDQLCPPGEGDFQVPPHLQAVGVAGGWAVLIPGEGRPYGLLGAYATQPRPFSADDVHFMQSVAHALGTALDRRRAERRLATQYAVTGILADALTVEAAGSRILQAVCQGLEWDLGVLWVVNPDTNGLVPTQVWQAPGLDTGAFVALTRSFQPVLGEGLLGEAWATGEPVWIADLDTRTAFPRKRSVAEAGLRSGFWLPVVMGKEVYGIIECFSREVRQPDRALLQTAVTIGGQIGQFIQRKRTEAALLLLNAELEQRVGMRTAELAAAYQELEAFAYSVSHDLRAPLRTIDGFGQALLEDCYDELGSDGHDHLRRIRSATRRMATLIDDLLRLSRVMRGDMHWKRVDLSRLARAVGADLRKGNPDNPVTLTVDDGLVVTGDERLLRLVLENLLANAWKFTGQSERPTVVFGTETACGERIYYVRDNGAGFDMRYAGKLFKPFQRLHSSKEFEGTGVGLATVQRIVQRHGGKVWAEGAVNQGASFYFTLGEKEAGPA